MRILTTLAAVLALAGSLAAQSVQQMHSLVVARKNSASGPIEFVAAAATSADGTGPTVNYPTVISGDIMLACFATSSAHNASGTPPAGWTKIVEVDQAGVDSTLSVFWKRAGSSEPASQTWTSLFEASELCVAIVAAYRNCAPSGNPVEAFNAGEESTGTSKSVGTTSLTNNAMAVAILGADPGSSTQSCAWDSPAVERIDYNTTPSGTNADLASIWIADDIIETAGAFTITGTISASDTTSETVVVLKR